MHYIVRIFNMWAGMFRQWRCKHFHKPDTWIQPSEMKDYYHCKRCDEIWEKVKK